MGSDFPQAQTKISRKADFAPSPPLATSAKDAKGAKETRTLSRRDRTKVARYEVPGKASIGEPSRRVRSDGLRSRIYNLAKGGCVDPKKSALNRGTPPSGPIIPFPTGPNLFLVATRHFVPG